MHSLPSGIDACTLPGWSVLEGTRRELEPQEVDALVQAPRQPLDDDELVEMRYQQLLARMILEELFSEAQMASLPARRQPNDRDWP
ncbi:MAG: hypothetical protein ACLQO1_09800 [Steroidobacteraceae bacterium]